MEKCKLRNHSRGPCPSALPSTTHPAPHTMHCHGRQQDDYRVSWSLPSQTSNQPSLAEGMNNIMQQCDNPTRRNLVPWINPFMNKNGRKAGKKRNPQFERVNRKAPTAWHHHLRSPRQQTSRVLLARRARRRLLAAGLSTGRSSGLVGGSSSKLLLSTSERGSLGSRSERRRFRLAVGEV